MSAHRCPRCGAEDLAFTDHDGACFPACGLTVAHREPFERPEPDPDVERWEIEERRADARRARWGHE